MPDADHCVFGPDRDRDVSAASSLAKSAVARRELYINVLFSLSHSPPPKLARLLHFGDVRVIRLINSLDLMRSPTSFSF